MGQLKDKRAMLGTLMDLHTAAFNRHINTVLLPQAHGSVKQALRVIALELCKGIMVRWPVDTGRSRAAWSVYLRRNGVPSPPLTGEQAAHKRGRAVTEGVRQGGAREALAGNKPFITLINGVVYAPWLEAGASKQAPAGAVRLAMVSLRKQTGDTFRTQLAGVR